MGFPREVWSIKYKQLGLRVLSTAALMSIVSSIAASAFAGTYYMDNGDVNVEVKENGDVYVNNQKDEDGEVIIKGGSGTNTWSNKKAEEQKAEEQQEETSIGESYPVEEEPEAEPAAEEPAEEETTEPSEDETPAESPNTISIKNDWKTNLKIILDNVNIKAGGSKAALSVTGKGSTTIELDGDNVLDSSETSGNAGLEVGRDTTVTITDTDGTVDDRASLKATGGNGGAGIGGAVDGKKVGNIIIEGTADVTATGSEGRYEGASGIVPAEAPAAISRTARSTALPLAEMPR